MTRPTLEEQEAFFKDLTPAPETRPEKQSYEPTNLEKKCLPSELTSDQCPDFPHESLEGEDEVDDVSLDDDMLTFGKYKGETPNQVSDVDPSWLVWAYDTVKNRPTCSPELAEWCRKQPPKPRGR